MTFESIEFPTLDVQERAASRVLSQFWKSPVFLQLLQAMLAEVEALQAVVEQIQRYRTCAEATGEQLNVIGRIVGIERELIDYDVINWFTPDLPYSLPDTVPVWVTNAPLANSFQADDFWFRQLIEAKIFRNFTKYGSVTELQEFTQTALGIDISVVRSPTQPFTVLLIVPDDTSINDLILLQRVGNNDTVDSVYFLPIPAGVQVAQVMYLSDYVSSWSQHSDWSSMGDWSTMGDWSDLGDWSDIADLVDPDFEGRGAILPGVI